MGTENPHSVTFDITASAESSTKTRVSTRGFEFVVDEPSSLGGSNEGPNPVEYVLGALAGCLNVVAHQVAREMDIEVRDLELAIDGDLNPAKFMGESDEPRAGYEVVRVDITADVDASDETVQQWLSAVEERCPVSDNLAHETPLDLAFTAR